MHVPVTKALFTREIPLIDVRAPVEFNKGAFPAAINLPILDDRERERVGISYKHHGPDDAMSLGHELVSGAVKEERVAAWLSQLERQPETHLYCFRGGQRSAIAAQWIDEAGASVPRIAGGYKAMRRFLLDSLDALPPLVVIAGRTGTGKTELLAQLPQETVVDLERDANHRGSAFGKRLTPQPAQIDFENSVAIQFLRASRIAFVEDESRMIGRVNLPLPLQEAMSRAPILLLEDSLAERVDRILQEYIVETRAELVTQYNDFAEAQSALHHRMKSALDAIQKRLGGVRHTEITAEMDNAFRSETNDPSVHRLWIERLLREYYDPMYDYQIGRKTDRIVGRGSASSLIDQALHFIDETDVT